MRHLRGLRNRICSKRWDWEAARLAATRNGGPFGATRESGSCHFTGFVKHRRCSIGYREAVWLMPLSAETVARTAIVS